MWLRVGRTIPLGPRGGSGLAPASRQPPPCARRVRGPEGGLIREVQKSALAGSSRVCLVLSASCPPALPPFVQKAKGF